MFVTSSSTLTTVAQSVLSSGIFKSEPGMKSFQVTGLWWLWICTTFPITFITILSWWFYRKHKEKNMQPVQLWFKNDELNEGENEKRRKSSVAEAFQNRSSGKRKSEVQGLSKRYNILRGL
jgi:hypothetical protein